jgi:Protein of unknown function (DUF3800)
LLSLSSTLDAEETALKIKRLRERLEVGQFYEFKFSKCSDYFRYQFLESVRDAPFRIRAMIVDKRILRSETLINNKETFYSYFVSELMQHNYGTIQSASLKMDGSGSREFKRAFQSYLRGKLQDGTISKCKFVDSSTDSLIQLADMASGAIYRQYNPTRPDNGFTNKVESSVKVV